MLKNFFINHPYNNIFRLKNMKSYEIKYIGFIFNKDTTLFKRFDELLEIPSVLNLIQILFYYCKTKYKYISIIYFYLEEIFADLSCFDKVNEFIHNISSNMYELMLNYSIRYNTNNIILFNKFLSNMMKINEFKNSLPI